MGDFRFTVDPKILDLGVKVVAARIEGVKSTSYNPDFGSCKNKILGKVKKDWEGKSYKDDPVLAGFRELHTKIGRSNRDYVASPESLRWLWLERGKFPRINILVDIYNLVSLKSGLALGAHDIDKIQGNVTLKITSGDEVFVPLGKAEPLRVFPGEYAYVDDGNNIICRLEVLQVEPTKVTTATQDVFLIVQGNTNTKKGYIRETAEEACCLIIKYCGGNCSFLNGA